MQNSNFAPNGTHWLTITLNAVVVRELQFLLSLKMQSSMVVSQDLYSSLIMSAVMMMDAKCYAPCIWGYCQNLTYFFLDCCCFLFPQHLAPCPAWLRLVLVMSNPLRALTYPCQSLGQEHHLVLESCSRLRLWLKWRRWTYLRWGQAGAQTLRYWNWRKDSLESLLLSLRADWCFSQQHMLCVSGLRCRCAYAG